MKDEKEITITKKRLAELEEKEMRFTSLEQAGVDNWEGWDIAIDIYDNWLAENKAKKITKEFCIDTKSCHDSMLEILCEEISEPAGSGAGYGFSEESIVTSFEVLEDLVRKIIQKLIKNQIEES